MMVYRMVPCPAQPKSTQRSQYRLAFTLTELLIALALTLVLAVAIFGAIRVQVVLTSAGQRAVLKAQITRSLIRQMQADVSGVVFSEPEPEESTEETEDTGLTLGSEDEAAAVTTGAGNTGSGTAGSTDSTTGAASTTETSDPSSALLNGASGIVGDSQQLVLHVSRPVHPVRLATTQSSAANTLISDEKSISWFLSGSTGITATSTGGVQGATTGLARMEGDRFAMQYSTDSGSAEQFGSLTKLLAPEVEQLSFRYFDGVNWVDTWDSTQMGRLPQAIEVTLGILLDDPAQAKIILGTKVQPQLEFITHTIRVTKSPPYVENMGL